MTTNPLDAIQARADAATEGPWEARTTGRAGGDHWYICDDGEAIAHISAQDGINEDQREPDAEFIAAARTDVPRLVAALRAVEGVHEPVDALMYTGKSQHHKVHVCVGCGQDDGNWQPWPCPTIRTIREALG